MKSPKISDFDPKIQKQAMEWVNRWRIRLMKEEQVQVEKRKDA